MRIRVDPIKCQGYGICIELAEPYFERDDWGLVQAKRNVEAGPDDHALLKAVEQCPIKAIRLIEE